MYESGSKVNKLVIKPCQCYNLLKIFEQYKLLSKNQQQKILQSLIEK